MLSNKTSSYNSQTKATVDIVICVHNALDYVKECLHSLFCKKTMDFNLIIVDDGSNQKTKEYLEEVANRNNAKLIRHNIAKGYTVSVNAGVRISKSDYVILLNSDTIVTKYWIEKLIECANSNPRTGVVGPLSNAASWQSVPYLKGDVGYNKNPLPHEINLEIISLLVEFTSTKKFPEVPFINGFCYVIKREVINKVGYFDEETFPKGYGEEDDYSIRVKKAGFDLRVADHCYIYHKKSASYTPKRRVELCKNAKKLLAQKQGEQLVEEYINKVKNNDSLKANRDNIKLAFDQISNIKDVLSKSILFLVDDRHIELASMIKEIKLLEKCGFNIKLAVKEKSKSELLEISSNIDDSFIFYNTENELVNKAKNFDLVILHVLNTPEVKTNNYIWQNTYEYKIGKNNSCQESEIRKGAWNKLIFLHEIIDNDRYEHRCDKKIVVYTAITGGYDSLKEPTVISNKCDYICFTDDTSLKSNVWEIRPITSYMNDNSLTARRYKILPHLFLKDYEYSVWIDGSIKLVANPEGMIKKELATDNMACFKHSCRNCIYDEAETIIKLEKANKDIVSNQIEKYSLENYPKKNGLIESGVLIRKHNNVDIIRLMNAWWNEIINFSERDQLSFNYVIWKFKLKYKIINKNIYDNEYLKTYKHQILDATKGFNVVSYGEHSIMENIGPVYYEHNYAQEIYSSKNNLNGILVFLATYKKQLITYFRFTLKENDKIVRSVILDNKEIKDNTYYPIIFEPILDSKNKRYTFTIRPIEKNVMTPITLGLGDNDTLSVNLIMNLNGQKCNNWIFHRLLYPNMLKEIVKR